MITCDCDPGPLRSKREGEETTVGFVKERLFSLLKGLSDNDPDDDEDAAGGAAPRHHLGCSTSEVSGNEKLRSA